MNRAATGQTLTVMVAGQHITLAGSAIAEILRSQPVTRVPLGPLGLLGVANLRGQVLPVVSLAALLGAADRQATAETRIVVVDDGAACGLQVDEVMAFGTAPDADPLDVSALLKLHFNTVVPPASVRAVGLSDTPDADDARDEVALVGLHLDGQDYALKLDDVVEIIALPSITMVPGADPAMLGVIDSRTGVLPLLSLRALLGRPLEGYDRTKARIVVTRVAGALVGLVIDGVTSILRVKRDAIEPVPPILTRGTGEAQAEAICRLEGGRRLVTQLSTDRLLDETTARRLAASAQPQTALREAAIDQAEADQFVIVRVGDEEYGLPIAAVAEVVRHPGAISRVPYAPSFVEGAMNLRGKIIPVIDQHQRFGAPTATTAARRDQRVVIIRVGALQAGFVVDAASALLTILRAELHPAQRLIWARSQVFDRIATLQSDGRMILIVDPKTLLNDAERDLLAAFVENAVSAP
jgi:purine-binding chemotaxis protein CheW